MEQTMFCACHGVSKATTGSFAVAYDSVLYVLALVWSGQVLDGTDHVNACKPLNPSDPAYTETVAFLRKLCAQFDQGKR